MNAFETHKALDIVVHTASAENFTLSLRIPAWSGATKIELNGKTVTGIKPGDYASAGRTWGEDSTLRVWLPQPLNLADPFAGMPATPRQP